MQRVYSTRTGLEAHDARLFLESQGVPAKVFGDNNALEVGFALTPATEPGVYVDEADVERAAGLLETFRCPSRIGTPRSVWKCSNCGEILEEQFEICWNCAEARPDAAVELASEFPVDPTSVLVAEPEGNATAPPELLADLPASSRGRLWCEVVLLLAITQPWLISNWLFSPLQLVWNGATFASQSAQIVAAELIIAGCALLFIGLSREPWSRFGIDRLRPLWDLFGTGILYFATGLTISMSNGLFLDLAREWLRPDDFDWLFRGSGRWVEPHGGLDLFIALGVSLCIGFSEELVYRGFLIPRFEQLIHSTWASVLLTSVLFAAMHWNQGLLNSWNALGFGLIFGIAFARFRHLWPLVFAHALVDFVVILRSGTDLT